MRLLLFSLLLFAQSLIAQTLQEVYTQAREAFQKKEYNTFYILINKAHELHPYHQGIMYQQGLAAALTNHKEEAFEHLKEALLINANFNLDIEELDSLKKDKSFQNLLTFQKQLQKPIEQSDTLFLVKDRSLHLESIAAGEKKGVFYLSSIHKRKIVRVDEKGVASDFTKSEQDGLTAVFGIKADPKTKTLWACSSPMPEMQHYDSLAKSAVFQYNLTSKKLMAKYTLNEEAVFGDLTISPSGTVYVSDSKNNIIYKVNPSTKKLEKHFTSDQFWNIQGITFTPDETYLFISDYIKGIFRLNTKTSELVLINRKIEASVKSVDGLLFYNNALIAIQNGVTPMRVTQYFLNKGFDSIVDYKIIDRGHSAFNEPTNGCVVNDALIYVANSQWSGYDEAHNIKPHDQLQENVILKYNLKND